MYARNRWQRYIMNKMWFFDFFCLFFDGFLKNLMWVLVPKSMVTGEVTIVTSPSVGDVCRKPYEVPVTCNSKTIPRCSTWKCWVWVDGILCIWYFRDWRFIEICPAVENWPYRNHMVENPRSVGLFVIDIFVITLTLKDNMVGLPPYSKDNILECWGEAWESESNPLLEEGQFPAPMTQSAPKFWIVRSPRITKIVVLSESVAIYHIENNILQRYIAHHIFVYIKISGSIWMPAFLAVGHVTSVTHFRAAFFSQLDLVHQRLPQPRPAVELE